MTETWTGPTNVEDIEDDGDTRTAALDRRADLILEADARRRPLRRAIPEDARQARDWARARAERLRGAVEAEPVRASLYALGLGVVLGLLAAR